MMTKTTLISIVFATISIKSYSQNKLDEYKSTYFDKTYDIIVGQDESDTSKYNYYIDCASVDKVHKQVCIDLSSKEADAFIDFLSAAKNTYTKWRETAKANNVTELNKKIETSFTCESAFVYDDWQFDHHVVLTPRAKIIDGEMYLIISSGELQSSYNESMKHDGFLLVFSSPDEVDEFISKIDINKVRAYFASKKKIDELFKN